jgi:hypothetical protein
VTAIIKVIASVLAVVKNIQLLEVVLTLVIYLAEDIYLLDMMRKMLIHNVPTAILF